MARRNEHERREQSLFFQWKNLREHQIPELSCLYAIPNEGMGGRDRKYAMIVGAQRKAEGRQKGVPDICLPVQRRIPPPPEGHAGPHGFYAALYIEMKTPTTYPKPEQRAWADRLERYGSKVVRRCTSWQDAARHVLSYLGHEVTRHGFPELFED
jgi:hypothetical protein